jgi:AcrR family transcriptional regulator
VSKNAATARVVEKPNRHERRRLRTKEAIIDAAAEMFRQKGVANTTVADITEAADLAYGTFYNHFDGVSGVIPAVAEKTFARVVRITDEVLPHPDLFELIAAVSVRVIMRLLFRDPAVRWLLEPPNVFVDEWRKIVTPSMLEVAKRYRGPETYTAIGGPDTWIRVFPWVVISELNDAIDKGSPAEQEENLANMAVHLMGLDDAHRLAVMERSRRLLDAVDL